MRAIVQGTGAGVLTAAAILATIVLFVIAPALSKNRAPTADEWGAAWSKAAEMSWIMVTGGVIMGVLHAVSTRTRRRSNKRRAQPPQTERPFSQRLDRFLGETSSAGLTEPLHAAPRSRMEFFMAVVPGRRFSPKPASYIRAILSRIHRLLGGG